MIIDVFNLRGLCEKGYIIFKWFEVCFVFLNFLAPEGTYPNGIRDVFKHAMKEEGIRALYKGATPVMLRAFPANAVSVLYLFLILIPSN